MGKPQLKRNERVVYDELWRLTVAGTREFRGTIHVRGVTMWALIRILPKLVRKGVIECRMAFLGVPNRGRRVKVLLSPDQVQTEPTREQKLAKVREAALMMKMDGLSQKQQSRRLRVSDRTIREAMRPAIACGSQR